MAGIDDRKSEPEAENIIDEIQVRSLFFDLAMRQSPPKIFSPHVRVGL